MNLFRDIYTADPLELATSMAKQYCIELPTEINDVASMTKAGTLLGQLTNQYSYLMSILVILKAMTRAAKHNKDKKEEYENMIARRDTVQDAADMVKQQYNAVSRMISTKTEIDREMRMQ